MTICVLSFLGALCHPCRALWNYLTSFCAENPFWTLVIVFLLQGLWVVPFSATVLGSSLSAVSEAAATVLSHEHLYLVMTLFAAVGLLNGAHVVTPTVLLYPLLTLTFGFSYNIAKILCLLSQIAGRLMLLLPCSSAPVHHSCALLCCVVILLFLLGLFVSSVYLLITQSHLDGQVLRFMGVPACAAILVTGFVFAFLPKLSSFFTLLAMSSVFLAITAGIIVSMFVSCFDSLAACVPCFSSLLSSFFSDSD